MSEHELELWPDPEEVQIMQTFVAALDRSGTESSDSDAHIADGYIYGRREIRGTRYQEWIDGDERVRCPVKPATLLLEDELMGLDVRTRFDPDLSESVAHDVARLKLGPGPGPYGHYADVCVWQTIPVCPERNPKGARNRWVADVGEGFLCMPEIFRLGAGSYSSDIYRAIYTRYYPIETLSHCFVTAIINNNTRQFVDRLYQDKGYPIWERMMIDDSDKWKQVSKPRLWAYGTPEYKALLGTRIGGVVATLLLSSFPRGTKRITQIQTFFKGNSSKMCALDMRFDIISV